MQHSADDLLKSYLGERTGERVLAGQTTCGEGERIHAVIWLCDVRDSTELSETIPLEEFFRSLNEFFDCTASAVLQHGGEVLSYIGDAVFAIFPIGETEKPLGEACSRQEGACAAALAAARDARKQVDLLNVRRKARGDRPLDFGLALHVGDVIYGNLGVAKRMQFTVIGAAANEAARLADLCKKLRCWILVSSAFPRCFPNQMISLGRHSMRGIDAPQEIFTLADSKGQAETPARDEEPKKHGEHVSTKRKPEWSVASPRSSQPTRSATAGSRKPTRKPRSAR